MTKDGGFFSIAFFRNNNFSNSNLDDDKKEEEEEEEEDWFISNNGYEKGPACRRKVVSTRASFRVIPYSSCIAKIGFLKERQTNRERDRKRE